MAESANLDLDRLEARALEAWASGDADDIVVPAGFAHRVVVAATVPEPTAKPPRLSRFPWLGVAASAALAVVGSGIFVFGMTYYGHSAAEPEPGRKVEGAGLSPSGPMVTPASPTGPQWAAPELPEDFAGQLDRYLASYGEHYGPAFAFQGVVMVARDGEVVFSRGYGNADLTPKSAGGTGRRNDPRTRFRIGSLTQQFTAVAVMQLREQGKLELDDSASKYVPAMAGVPDVRIRHLLTHTSGLWNFTDDPVFALTKAQVHETDALVKHIASLGTGFDPGTDFEATNSNYLVLGEVIESASGQSYAAYLREHVLGPAGMRHTTFGDAYDTGEQARGYAFNEQEFLEPAEDIHLPNMGAAAGLVSTPIDMVEWDRALYDGTLLQPESLAAMYRPVRNDYALGWVIGRVFGRDVVGHPGGVDGFNAHFMRFLDDHTMVLAIANTEVIDCRRVAADVAALVYGHEPEPRVEHSSIYMDPRLFGRYEGRYTLTEKTRKELGKLLPKPQLDRLAEVRIVRDADGKRLWMRVPGHGSKWMHPMAEGRFFFKDDAGTIGKFFGDASDGIATIDEGRARWLVLEQPSMGGGREFLLERADDVP